MKQIIEENTASFACSNRVPAPQGWTYIDKLRPGQYIFGHDGKPVQIHRVIKTEEPNVRVTLSDHRSYICSAYAQLGPLLSAHKAMRRLNAIKNYSNTPSDMAVPGIRPVNYAKKELPLPPYLMGLFCREDTEYHDDAIVLHHMKQAFIKRLSQTPLPPCKSFQYATKTLIINSPKIVNILRKLYRNDPTYASAYIAPEFLTGCIFERTEVLAGILDVTGRIVSEGMCIRGFTYSMGLSIVELLASLGIPAVMTQDHSIRIFTKDLPLTADTAALQLQLKKPKDRTITVKKVEMLGYMSGRRLVLDVGDKFLIDNYIPVTTNSVKDLCTAQV